MKKFSKKEIFQISKCLPRRKQFPATEKSQYDWWIYLDGEIMKQKYGRTEIIHICQSLAVFWNVLRRPTVVNYGIRLGKCLN